MPNMDMQIAMRERLGNKAFWRAGSQTEPQIDRCLHQECPKAPQMHPPDFDDRSHRDKQQLRPLLPYYSFAA